MGRLSASGAPRRRAGFDHVASESGGQACRRCARRSRWRRGRTGWSTMRSRMPRRICQKRSSTNDSVFMPESAERHSRTASALAEGSRLYERRPGRRGGQGLCRTVFSDGGDGEGTGDDQRPGKGVLEAHRRAILDVARNRSEGEAEAGDFKSRRGISGSLARLRGAGDRKGRRAGERAAGRDFRIPLSTGETAPID